MISRLNTDSLWCAFTKIDREKHHDRYFWLCRIIFDEIAVPLPASIQVKDFSRVIRV